MRLTWRWLRYVWRGQGGGLVWLLVGSALTAVLHAGFAWLWKVVVDAAADGDLTGAALRCLAVGLGQSLLYVAVQGTRTRVNERIQQAARRRVLAAIAASAPGALTGWRTGDLLTRLTDDVSTEKLAWFLCSGVFRAYEAALIVAACVTGMLWIDPALTVWAVAPLPLLVVAQLFAGRELGRRADAVQQGVSRVGGVIQDVYDGVRVVQARGLGGLAQRAFADAVRVQADAEVHNARLAQLQMVLFGYGWQIALAALIWAGGLRVMNGTLGAGDFVAFNGFVMTLVFPMFDFGAFLVRWRQASASLRRLQALVELPAHGAPPLPTPSPSSSSVRLPARLDTTWLRLDLGAELELSPGDMLAVTGPIGTGKSTLLAALAGQVDTAASGSGETAAGPLPAWVPQEAVILSVTVAENILLGAPATGAWGPLLAAARLEDDLARFPLGLNTPVGERGVTLSGGQQQRVQIARALATPRPLLLLDDATSALDADTEARFWEGLDRAERIVVAVTHRAATLDRADRVLYLRAGEPAVIGSHAELVARHASYRAAYGGEPGPSTGPYTGAGSDVEIDATAASSEAGSA